MREDATYFCLRSNVSPTVTCGVCRSGSVQSVSTAGVSELTLASSNTNTDPLLPHDENTEMETTSVGDSLLHS